MQLTGYSQATVSLTLQKLQLLMPIRKIRKIGNRKHYYAYDGSPERFVLDLWQMRVETQAIDIKQIETMIERIEDKANMSPALKRFFHYLKNMRWYLRLVRELRNNGIAKFEDVLESGSFEGMSLQDSKKLERGRLAKFLEKLRGESIDNTDASVEAALHKEYILTKNEYYSSFKTNLNPLYAQTVANQMIVIHDVFLERNVTQKQIERASLLPRSTISETLSASVKMGFVRVSKKKHSRIKLYQPTISFSDLMLSNYDQVARHVTQVMPRLAQFIEMVKKTRSRSVETRRLLEILNGFEKAYSFTRDFSNSMKVEMVIRMKEEYDRGFVFI
jgi:DNA-binding transcriptional regulator GbsR (MarR family)